MSEKMTTNNYNWQRMHSVFAESRVLLRFILADRTLIRAAFPERLEWSLIT